MFVPQTLDRCASRSVPRVCVVDNLIAPRHTKWVDEGAIYRAFGQAIAERRNAVEKTQEKVAADVGLSRASLANIERGKQRVFLHQIWALTEALGLTSSHEIVPARAVSARSGDKANVTMSGEKLSRDQKIVVSNIVNALLASKPKNKK